MKKKEKIRFGRQKRREKEAKRAKISKAKRWSLLLAAVFFAFAAFVIVWQMLTVSFDEAVRNPEVREKYIANLVKKVGKPESVKEVFYADTQDKLEYLRKEYGYHAGQMVWMVILQKEEVITGELRKKFAPEKIAVFPYAFSGDILKTEEDFKSSLLHEYRHAETYLLEEAGGVKIAVPPLILAGNEKLFSAVMEIDAVRKELRSELKLSASYREGRYRFYLENYVSIWEGQWDADAKFIEELKIKFFESWMQFRPEMKAEIVAGTKSWYLEHPATKRKYYLPEEVVRSFPGNP